MHTRSLSRISFFPLRPNDGDDIPITRRRRKFEKWYGTRYKGSNLCVIPSFLKLASVGLRERQRLLLNTHQFSLFSHTRSIFLPPNQIHPAAAFSCQQTAFFPFPPFFHFQGNAQKETFSSFPSPMQESGEKKPQQCVVGAVVGRK